MNGVKISYGTKKLIYFKIIKTLKSGISKESFKNYKIYGLAIGKFGKFHILAQDLEKKKRAIFEQSSYN